MVRIGICDDNESIAAGMKAAIMNHDYVLLCQDLVQTKMRF